MKLRKPSILVVNWVSSSLSFFPSASTAVTDIFTAPNCTTTITSLEHRALNAEFQHFTLRFNKNVFTLWIPLKEGIGCEGGRKTRWRQGYFTDNSIGCLISNLYTTCNRCSVQNNSWNGWLKIRITFTTISCQNPS
jgi:hypothetical protein